MKFPVRLRRARDFDARREFSRISFGLTRCSNANRVRAFLVTRVPCAAIRFATIGLTCSAEIFNATVVVNVLGSIVFGRVFREHGNG